MIDIGIPNLSTPAAIIDRIIIEKLKIVEFNRTSNTDQVELTQKIVDLLIKQLSKISGVNIDLIIKVIDLTISVGQVSYCENTKAYEHKYGAQKDNAYIAHLDYISRMYNELRSLHKKEIDSVYQNLGVDSILWETRTF